MSDWKLFPHSASKLITDGTYKLLGNPIYLALSFLIFGASIIINTI